MKKVIITGILGQDGSFMADELLKLGLEVYGVTRHGSNLNFNNILQIRSAENFHLVSADLTDSQSIDRIVQEIKPDYFINFAANSFVGVSWEMPIQVAETNTIGVISCLEAIRKFVPQCKFYNAGSSEEFGDVVTSPQDESHPLRPRSPYGASKAAARHFVKVYRESYNMFAIQSWCYNHESFRRPEQFVTRKITKRLVAIENERFCRRHEMYYLPSVLSLGNIHSRRDWSHARDMVKAIWLMLNNEKPVEYVVSSDETHSIKEFIETAAKCLKLDLHYHPECESFDPKKGKTQIAYSMESQTIPVVVISPEFYRPAEVDLLHGNSSKLRKDLGWKPEYNFESLVQEMVNHDQSLTW